MCAEAAAPTQLAVASCERPSQCPANLNLVRPPSPAVPRAVPAPPWPSCTTGGTARWETCQTWPPCRPSRWGWAPHAGLPAAEVERILWAAEAWHGAGRPAKRAGLPGARAACGPQAQMQASVGLAGLPACPLVSQPKAAAACRPPASTLSPPLRPPPAPPHLQVANPGFAHTFQLIDVPDFNGRGESCPLPYFYQVRAWEARRAGAGWFRALAVPAAGVSGQRPASSTSCPSCAAAAARPHPTTTTAAPIALPSPPTISTNTEPGRGGDAGVCVPVHAAAGLPRPQNLSPHHLQRTKGAAAGRV